MEPFQIDVNGQNVKVFEWGHHDLPTLLYLHGLTDNALSIVEIAERLQDRYHIVSFDLPGHGETPAFLSEEEYEFVNMTSWIHNVVKTLKLKTFHLLNFSWGGALALYYTGVHPEQVSGIISFDGGYLFPTDQPNVTLKDAQQNMFTGYEKLRFDTWTSWKEHVEAESSRLNKTLLEVERRGFHEKDGAIVPVVSPETAAAGVRSFFIQSPWEHLGKVQAPMLLFKATVPKELEEVRQGKIDELSQRLSGPLTVVSVEEAGHSVHVDGIDDVVHELEQFLEKAAVEKKVQ